jgi:tetratricopeptide (TPR) repeat protein
MKFYLPIIIVLLALSCENVNEVDFKEARKQRKLKKYEESNEILNGLIEKNYKLDTVFYLIASNYLEIGMRNDKISETSSHNYSQAINNYTNAIRENSNYFEAYKSRWISRHNNNEHKDNLREINEAMTLFQDSINLVLHRGVTKNSLDDFNGSDIDLNTFLEYKNLDTNYISRAYRWLGRNHYERREFEEAVEDYSKAINLDTVNTFYLYYENRGQAYKGMGDYENACKDFRKATDLGYLGLIDEIKNYCN